jgi:magnesium chelatase subunit ChlD-like protein
VKTLGRKGSGPLQLRDLRYRPQPLGSNTLHCVLLDMSASMLRGEKLALAKGCLLALTERVYRRREHLAVIGFGGNEARLLQAPGKVATFNAVWIAPLRGGGATPGESALQLAQTLMQRSRKASTVQNLSLWLLTDGRFAALPARPALADSCHIVDFENEAVALRRCQRLARDWDAQWIAAAQLNRV